MAEILEHADVHALARCRHGPAFERTETFLRIAIDFFDWRSSARSGRLDTRGAELALNYFIVDVMRRSDGAAAEHFVPEPESGRKGTLI